MEFSIHVFDAYFAEEGRYYLRLSMVTVPEPPGGIYDNVTVQLIPDEATQNHMAITDTVGQEIASANQPPKPVLFVKNQVQFRIKCSK